MRFRRLLCRREASEYLLAQHGLDVSPEQLARWAVKGGGPPFHLLAGRIGKAVYCTIDLDKWANGYLGPLVARVAEHPAGPPEKIAHYDPSGLSWGRLKGSWASPKSFSHGQDP